MFHLSLPAKLEDDVLILVAEFRSYHLEPTPKALTDLFRIIKTLCMEGLPLQEWVYFIFPFNNVINWD